MPTAEIAVSTSCVSDLPPASIVATTLSAPRSSFLTVGPSKLFIPCFTNCFFAIDRHAHSPERARERQ
jgi:hypothetical protein